MDKGVVSVGRLGVRRQINCNKVNVLGEHFEKYHWAKLLGLLENSLCEHVLLKIEAGEFYERVYKEIGPNRELCLKRDLTVALLNFVMNNAELFRVIEAISDCGHIGSFVGRVYRFMPGSEHFSSWHNDAVQNRLVGISLNLSAAKYSGGLLQLRYWEDQ